MGETAFERCLRRTVAKMTIARRVAENSVESPCKQVCMFDDEMICVGCGRKLSEVRDWPIASEEEKRRVLDRIEGKAPGRAIQRQFVRLNR